LGRGAIGARVELEGTLSPTSLLFSESPSRIIISFDPSALESVKKIAEQHNAPFAIVGRVGGDKLVISVGGKQVVNADITDLESTWRNGLSRKLQAEVPVTV
jgi:phosphoribosylformylglycinamidine synthase